MNKPAAPLIAIIISILLWGFSFAGMRIVLRDLSPMAVMWCRMITALIIILPFIKKLIPDNYQKGDWKLLIPMVLLQPCLYFLLETNALLLTTTTQAGVIVAAAPIFVTIGARFFFQESMNRLKITGLLISVVGVVVLTGSQGLGGAAPNPVLGNLMEVTATLFAAGNLLIIKKLSNRYSAWTLIAMQIIAGTMFFTPGFFQLIKTDPAVWNIRLIMILIYLGIFVSLGAYSLQYWAVSKLNTSTVSIFINLIPVVVIITGWTFLGETLTIIQLLAAAGVIAGVMLSQHGSRTQYSEHELTHAQ